jgi:hypothetical protein
MQPGLGVLAQTYSPDIAKQKKDRVARMGLPAMRSRVLPAAPPLSEANLYGANLSGGRLTIKVRIIRFRPRVRGRDLSEGHFMGVGALGRSGDGSVLIPFWF